MYMIILPTCMSLYHFSAWFSQNFKDGLRCLRTRVIAGGFEMPCDW